MNAKPIVVFDTQLLLRATINRRSLPAKLFFDLNTNCFLAASTQTIAEARDVLNRPVLRTKFPTLSDEAVNETIYLLVNARQVVLKEVASVSRDPKDDIFLATALEAQADYLVSEDNTVELYCRAWCLSATPCPSGTRPGSVATCEFERA